MEIRMLHQQGLNAREIARRTGHSRNTVERYLRSAVVLLHELHGRGYVGGITILREYLARLRPAVVQEPVARFETEPGRQMQVDWAELAKVPAA